MTGRPRKYKSVDELSKIVDDFFAVTPQEKWTITGLALHLGFTSRQALINYEKRDEYFDTIKKAKLMVEHSYELDLKEKGNTGTIFALKNFEWIDKHVNETKLDNNIKIDEDTTKEAKSILGNLGL